MLALSLSSGVFAQDLDELDEDETDPSVDVFNDFGEPDQEFEEMAEDERFFRYGRFLSLGVGGGITEITGNRGVLYGRGTPTVKISLVYFFDFNFALGISYVTSQHAFFLDNPDVQGVEVKLDRWHFDLRYYFNTKNLSAILTTLNPYVFAGIGPWKRTEVFIDGNAENSDSAVGMGAGIGFDIKLAKGIYFSIETRYDTVPFSDRTSDFYLDKGGPADLAGNFITLTGSAVFSW
jgi:hypothetical protein